jgi:hypothetical protein
MGRYSGIPELLEQFMDEQETDEWWITVHELRDRFNLTRYQCNTVSGFLRRLGNRPFKGSSFTVIKIERITYEHRSYPKICRYLVKRKNGDQKDHVNENLE